MSEQDITQARVRSYLERARREYLPRAAETTSSRRPWLVAATAALAALAAVRRRPLLAGAAALVGLLASRLSRKPPNQRRSAADARDRARPLDPHVTVTSMGYPAPPTVTVGPAAVPST